MIEASTRLVGSDKPRFTIEGQERDRLRTDLIRMEASHDEEGMARLEAVFTNWGQAEEGNAPSFLYFDGQIIDLGRTISVQAGEGDEEAVIFEGKITAVAGNFPDLRPPELRIQAEDAFQPMRMRQRTRLYEQENEAGMVSRIAGDHGLSGRADAEGTEHKELWQVNQDDLAFLRERARAADARLEVGSSELRFVPRRVPSDEPIRLSKLNKLLRFEAVADLAHQRTRVITHGYSVADKEAIHEASEVGDLQAESHGGRLGPQVLDEIGWETIEHMHLEMPASRTEAQALARAEMLRRGRRFVVGRGMTSGTPKLKVGAEVELSDVGAWFSGRWNVCAVRHCFDFSQGLRTHFVAERVDMGRSA